MLGVVVVVFLLEVVPVAVAIVVAIVVTVVIVENYMPATCIKRQLILVVWLYLGEAPACVRTYVRQCARVSAPVVGQSISDNEAPHFRQLMATSGSDDVIDDQSFKR